MYSAVSGVHLSDMLSELLLAAWIVRFSRVNRFSSEKNCAKLNIVYLEPLIFRSTLGERKV